LLSDINTGETRAGSPDSVLVETVKKLNEADNLVVSLRQQLRVKNEGDNFSWMEHQMEQCLESDLQCNICYEMFIKVILLIQIYTIDNDYLIIFYLLLGIFNIFQLIYLNYLFINFSSIIFPV